jgi:hypothetical protein
LFCLPQWNNHFVFIIDSPYDELAAERGRKKKKRFLNNKGQDAHLFLKGRLFCPVQATSLFACLAYASNREMWLSKRMIRQMWFDQQVDVERALAVCKRRRRQST